MKRPAFQFYPGDWLRDTALQSCSIAARGLWIQLLCYMHDGEPYGHLAVAGQAIPAPKLAQMVGLRCDRFSVLIRVLERAKVLTRTDRGTIYSRRMVRDEALREKRAAGGIKSIEHPNTPKPKGTLHGTHIGYAEGSSAGPSPAVAVATASAREERAPATAAPPPTTQSWVTPLGDDWSRAYGGLAPHGQISKHLKPLMELHGLERVQSHWQNYLAAIDAKRASPAWFAEQFGAWETPRGDRPRPKPQPSTTKTVAEPDEKGRMRLVVVPIDDPRPSV